MRSWGVSRGTSGVEERRDEGLLTHGAQDEGREEQAPVVDRLIGERYHEGGTRGQDGPGHKTEAEGESGDGDGLGDADADDGRDAHGEEAGGDWWSSDSQRERSGQRGGRRCSPRRGVAPKICILWKSVGQQRAPSSYQERADLSDSELWTAKN